MEGEKQEIIQEKQLDEKAQKRHRMLKNIFRNHRELSADREFEELVAQDK